MLCASRMLKERGRPAVRGDSDCVAAFYVRAETSTRVIAAQASPVAAITSVRIRTGMTMAAISAASGLDSTPK